MRSRIVVASDFHISAGELDDCDAELQELVCSFLQRLRSEQSPVHLVLNGDLLDFVQAPPWQGKELESTAADGTPLCFTEEQSAGKLEAIRKAHPALFAALGMFLDGPAENTITILPGNHDADFFWPSVQEAFRSAAGIRDTNARDRLRFHLDQVYSPADASTLWIEHGHQHDRVNRFEIDSVPVWGVGDPPIRKDRKGVPRLVECVGTRFLIRFINRLDRDYHFVDNIKPLSRFFGTFGASVLLPGYGPTKALFSVAAMMRYLLKAASEGRGDLLDVPEHRELALSESLAAGVERLPEEAREAFAAELDRAGFENELPLDMLLEDENEAGRLLDLVMDRPELLDSALPATEGLEEGNAGGLLSLESAEMDGDGTLALGRSFLSNETTGLIRAARGIIDRGDATAIVMGHTHDIVEPTSSLAYTNTGAWTRYYPLGSDEALPYWGILRQPYSTFPYKLRYAVFDTVEGLELLTHGSSDEQGAIDHQGANRWK